jgi:hypothetical protein
VIAACGVGSGVVLGTGVAAIVGIISGAALSFGSLLGGAIPLVFPIKPSSPVSAGGASDVVATGTGVAVDSGVCVLESKCCGGGEARRPCESPKEADGAVRGCVVANATEPAGEAGVSGTCTVCAGG